LTLVLKPEQAVTNRIWLAFRKYERQLRKIKRMLKFYQFQQFSQREAKRQNIYSQALLASEN